MEKNNRNQNEGLGLVPIDLLIAKPPPQQQVGPAPLEVAQIECEISEELSRDVFENVILREMILEFVIFPNGEVSRPDVKTVRLVRKNWLQTTADSMCKFGAPITILKLDNRPEKLLDKFVRSMASSTRLLDLIPQFSLMLLPEFFREENHQNFSDCLISCGEALINLHIYFPINTSMALVFPSFHLPKLQNLAVRFSNHLLNDTTAGNHSNAVTICFLQTIFNATNELKQIFFVASTSDAPIPFGFPHLALPNTVTSLVLDYPLKDGDLQLLVRNDLPKLTILSLFATNTPFSGGVIFQILDKFRTNLKSLSLNGRIDCNRDRNWTLFKFPVMEKLEILTVTSKLWELEENLDPLESQLPKMSELIIERTKESMFTKWTRNSKFEAVKHLSVSLVTLTEQAEGEILMPITLEKMQSLHLAFPNLVNLDVTLCKPLSFGLNYLFMEMRSLKRLIIKISAMDFLPCYWDSILIGVPPNMVKCFRKNPDYLKMVDLKDDKNFPSIRKLTSLEMLTLVDFSSTLRADQVLISDLAFLKMPNLKKLGLYGRFSPSAEMTERWRQEKGTELVHGIAGR